MLLHHKTALITGATGGIGTAIAKTFAAEGARVILTGRDPGIAESAREISTSGGDAVSLSGDITDPSFVKSLVSFCKTNATPLHILVNNAGILLPGVIGMSTERDMRSMLEVNVIALTQITQYMVRLMDKEQGGSIVNLCSIAGTKGLEGMSAYSATKGAVAAYTLAAAKELVGRNIRVNAVAPGFVDTRMTRSLSPNSYQKGVESIRMGRLGSPQDVANAVLFFSSHLSSYITGQILGVDGGMSA